MMARVAENRAADLRVHMWIAIHFGSIAPLKFRTSEPACRSCSLSSTSAEVAFDALN